MPPVALSHPETSDSPAPEDAAAEAISAVGSPLPDGVGQGTSAIPDDIASLDYFAIEGEKARLVLELRARMEGQRAGHGDQEQQ